MAGLPAFILFGFSALIWILRTRHIRTIWILTLTSFFLAWLSTFLLATFLPAELVFSQWETQHLLGSEIKIEIDSNSIILLNSVLILGILITLSYDGKEESIDARELFSLCFVGGFGLVTILSGNFITFAILWVIWEIVMIFIKTTDDRSDLTMIGMGKIAIQRLVSVPLALTVGVLLSAGVDWTSRSPGLVINSAFILGVLVVIVRIYLSSYSEAESMKPVSMQSGSIWIPGLTIVAGFSFLNRIFESESFMGHTPIMVTTGVLLIAAGIIQSFSITIIRRNLFSSAITLLGIGVLIQAFQGESQIMMLELLGSTLLLVYVFLVLPISTQRWSIVSAIGLGSLLIGLPGSTSSIILIAILEAIETGIGYILAALCLIGLASVAANIVRSRLEELEEYPSEQNTNLLGEITAPLLILVTGLVMGLMLRPGISVSSVSLFTFVFLLSGLGTYAYTKLDPKFRPLNPGPLLQGMTSWTTVAWRAATNVLTILVRVSGRVFEGRAGLLWVYVIVQLIIVALGVVE